MWARWKTALGAVFQIPVGALLASIGMAASMPYAAARRSKAAGLLEWRKCERALHCLNLGIHWVALLTATIRVISS